MYKEKFCVHLKYAKGLRNYILYGIQICSPGFRDYNLRVEDMAYSA